MANRRRRSSAIKNVRQAIKTARRTQKPKQSALARKRARSKP